MIFIGGVQTRKKIVARESRICPNCHHHEMQQIRVDHYFALFFVPLFPVKRGKPFWQCAKCQAPVDNTDYNDSGGAGKCRFCSGTIHGDYAYCPHCGRSQ